MAIRTFRPVTPGLRHRVQVINGELTSNENGRSSRSTVGKSAALVAELRMVISLCDTTAVATSVDIELSTLGAINSAFRAR